MKLSLEQLFAVICREADENTFYAPGIDSDGQCDLFGSSYSSEKYSLPWSETDINIIAGIHSSTGPDFSALPQYFRRLFELSANSFDAIVHAWMSEFPIMAEIIRFGRNIHSAAEKVSAAPDVDAETGQRRRLAAEKAATDRGNIDVKTVQAAAYKVWHEINRLMGLLRFSPNELGINAGGIYTARCGPDHFILPALGPHFKERFGKTPWSIIDEKRGIGLNCKCGGQPVLSISGKKFCTLKAVTDNKWEQLWRQYFKTINNETRYNPGLQQKFMPKRYRKYLTEF
jgi:hypothetical protein